MTGVAGFIAKEGSHDTSDDNDDLIATQWIPHSGRAGRPGRPHPPCPHALMSSLPPYASGRADRPRSADGMGSGFISRSDDVPDLMSAHIPRTSRDAGPYRRERGSRAVWRWRLAVRHAGKGYRAAAWGLASPRAAMACLTSCQGPCLRITMPACPLCLPSTQHSIQHSVLDPALFPLISTLSSALLTPHPFNRFNTFSLPRTRSTPCRWAPPPCPETA